MTKPCPDMTLLIQAEIDGELDAGQAASLASHRSDCLECEATYTALRALRREVKVEITRYAAPAALREALEAQLAGSSELATPSPGVVQRAANIFRDGVSWWRSGLTFGAGALAATVLTFVVMAPAEKDLGDLVVSDHIRALQPGHLLDVVSTDRHNVKPWFDGKLDFAPPVKDLADRGFPLAGGRLDYLDGHEVAALVYHSRQHPINLFIWPSPKPGQSASHEETRNGYNVIRWNENDMTIWVVSDLNRKELNDFAREWRQIP